MKKTAIAIATASLLLITGPALADRGDDRHKYRGVPKSHHQGSALRNAYHKAQRRSEHRSEGKHRAGNNYRGNRGVHHQPRNDHHKGNDRKHRSDRNRNRGHDKNHRRDWRDLKHSQRKVRRQRYAGHRYSWVRHHRPHRPVYRHGYVRHRPRWRPSHYHYGYRWRHLPSSFVRLSVGGLGFFYSDGIFYRPYDYGYVVAQPPIGVVVYSLPASAVSVAFGGYNYYVAYDTCYLWDGRGYRVVANPGISL